MHWTDLLSRRHLAPDAMVVGDLPCVACGYNLRAIAAAGRCPECGAAVSTSLCVLRRPREVASGLRGLAWSFGGTAAALLVFVGVARFLPGITWVGVGLLLCFGVYRVVSLYELRFGCALENLPSIGGRLHALFVLALADFALLVAGTVLLYLAGRAVIPGGGVTEQLLGLVASLWVISIVASALVIGSLGSALAAILGYGFVEREFAIQRALIVAGVIAGAVLVLIALAVGAAMGSPAAVRVVALLALGVFLLTWAVAHGFTVVGLLHLAAASERDLDIRDEVIGTDGSARGRRAPTASSGELPPISLEPGEE